MPAVPVSALQVDFLFVVGFSASWKTHADNDGIPLGGIHELIVVNQILNLLAHIL